MIKQINHAPIEQIELAKKLLQTVRHAAYATSNEDGTPHNSPLMLIYNENLTKLYVGSYSESQHAKNFVRTGKTFAVLYDSFTRGQGGVYITGVHAHECTGDELVEALRVHNAVRATQENPPLDIRYYQADKPSQRMYSIGITKIEVYSAQLRDDGLVVRETRATVTANDLLSA